MSIIKTVSRLKSADAAKDALPSTEVLLDLKAEQRASALLALQLKQAMSKRQFQLNYQLQLSLPSQQIEQWSVHLIWPQAQQLISHTELQAMAHRAGHAPALCNYLLIHLSHDLEQLRLLGLIGQPIHIQLSPQLLSLPAYMNDFSGYLHELGVSADDIVLEFTLAQTLREDSEVKTSLNSLKGQGLEVILNSPALMLDLPEAPRDIPFVNLPRGLYHLQNLSFEDVCHFAYQGQQAFA